jgi:hypothetical protein
MKQILTIIAFWLACLPIAAQDRQATADTIHIEPMVSERLHGKREATEAEKQYARMLAQERQEQQQIDENLLPVDENGQIVAGTDLFYPFLYHGFHSAPWHLHKGLNVNVGASVFANFGGGSNRGAGFTQDISLMYVTNLSKKATLAVGGYFNNTIWGGDNYTAAGINAMLGYRFDEHWSAYAFVQKAFTSKNYSQMGWYDPYWGGYYPGWGHYYPMGFGGNSNPYRNMDRIGAGLRYEWGNHNYIQIQVEFDHMPSQRGFHYNHRRYDYPVR